MCLCSERNRFSCTLKHSVGTVLLQDVREGIPDTLPIAGISEAYGGGQAGGEGTTEALHTEQRGLKFVWCHGGVCGGAHGQFTGLGRRSTVCCAF